MKALSQHLTELIALAEDVVRQPLLAPPQAFGARAAGVHAVLLDPHDDWPEVDCERFPDLGTLADAIVAAR